MVDSIGSNLIQQYINGLNPTNSTNPTTSNTASPPTAATQNDSVSFLEMFAKMNRNKELSFSGTTVEDGKINNQYAIVKTVFDDSDNAYQEGKIGDKELNLIISENKSSTSKEISYQGSFNNKNIELTLSIPQEPNIFKRFYNQRLHNRLYIPDTMTVKGTIDNVPYEITLPNAKVPENSDEKDLLMLILNNHDYNPGIANGKIISIAPGENKIRRVKNNAKKRDEFFATNISPLISQTLSTTLGAVLALALAKFGLRR